MNTVKKFVGFVVAGFIGSLAGKGIADTIREIKSDLDKIDEERRKDSVDACKWRIHEEMCAPYLITVRYGELYQLRGPEEAREYLIGAFGKVIAEEFINGTGVETVLYHPRFGYKYKWLEREVFESDLNARIAKCHAVKIRVQKIKILKNTLKDRYDSGLWNMAKDLAKEAVEIFYKENENKKYKIANMYELTPNFLFDYIQPYCYIHTAGN